MKSNISNAAEDGNILTQVRGWFRKASDGNRQNFSKVAYYRNPNSIVDETLIGLWIIAGFAIAFTVAYGGYYHYTIFKGGSGAASVGIIISFALFCVAEFLKVFLGLHFFRSVFSGLWFRSFAHLAFTAGVLALVLGAFMWSIGISSKGVGEVNGAIRTGELLKSSPFDPTPLSASYDAQIADAERSIRDAAKMRWKGNITVDGQRIIKRNTDLKNSLSAQKASLIEKASAVHDSTLLVQKSLIRETALRINDYGGKAEYMLAICLLLIALAEVIAYRNNRKQLFPETTSTPPKQPETVVSSPKQSETTYSQHIPGTDFSQNIRRPIGFDINRYREQPETVVSRPMETVVSAPPETPVSIVPQRETVVSTNTETTRIVVISEDLEKLQKYCREYFKRSWQSVAETTRENNRKRFDEYKNTLELSGKYRCIETSENGQPKLIIEEITQSVG